MKFDNDKPQLTLDKAELEALHSCAFKDPAAINIHAIHIDPAARTVVACDGHSLLLGTEVGARAPAPGSAITVSAKHVAAWLRFASKNAELVLTWDAKNVYAHIDEQKLEAPLALVKYPPWRAVVPKKPGPKADVPHKIGLGAALIVRVLEALQKVGLHGQKTCVAWNFSGEPYGENPVHPAEEQPVVLTVQGHDSQWRALIMPMRYADEDKVDPWRTAFPEPQKEAPKIDVSKAADILAAVERSRAKRKKPTKKKPAAKKKAKRGRR